MPVRCILPGTLTFQHVDDGAMVEADQDVFAIECMKQETTHSAPASGKVRFLARLGELVEQDQVIAEIEVE